MNLKQFIDRRNMIADCDATSKEETIKQLAGHLHANGCLFDADAFLAAVREREAHCTTGIGGGVAIPHGNTSAVKQTSVAVAKLSNGVDWQAMDEKPVNLVFLLAVQETDAADTHLRLLQEIAIKLMDDAIVAALHQAATTEDILLALEMDPG